MHNRPGRRRRSFIIPALLSCLAVAAASCSTGPPASSARVAARSTSGLPAAGADDASSSGPSTIASSSVVVAPSGTLSSVSCLNNHDCEAVGYHIDHAGDTETLAERWNGQTWVAQRTPALAGTTASTLNAVSCASSSDCKAVGYAVKGRDQRVLLAESWNGRTWTVQNVPSPPGPRSILNGVSCPSSRSCEAVGYYTGTSGAFVTLAEAWNGRTWVIQRTPDPVGAQGSFLLSVSCATSDACEAVADDIDRTGAFVTLAEGWNGRAWNIQATPDPGGSRAGVLWAVSCVAGRSCEAVGEYTGRAGTEVPLAEGWNGATWKEQTTAHYFGGGPSLLESVSCVTGRACQAVGERTDGTGVETALALGWNGRAWKQETTPALRGSAASLLESVSCAISAGCEAVGASTNRFEVGQTLGEEWVDGTWRVMATPTPR